MWIATKYGFYSVVFTEEYDRAHPIQLRARFRHDLNTLLNILKHIRPTDIAEYPHADYRFRVALSVKEFSIFMNYLSITVDYPNFKDKIADTPEQADKLSIYTYFYGQMRNLANKFYEVQKIVKKVF